MAQSKLFSDSLVSKNDLSSGDNQYHIVKLDSAADRKFELAGAGDQPYGVLQDDAPDEGEVAEIMVMGITFLELGGSITRGQMIKPDSNGKGVHADSGGDKIVGIARESGNSGEIISVLLLPGTVVDSS